MGGWGSVCYNPPVGGRAPHKCPRWNDAFKKCAWKTYLTFSILRFYNICRHRRRMRSEKKKYCIRNRVYKSQVYLHVVCVAEGGKKTCLGRIVNRNFTTKSVTVHIHTTASSPPFFLLPSTSFFFVCFCSCFCIPLSAVLCHYTSKANKTLSTFPFEGRFHIYIPWGGGEVEGAIFS